MSKHPSPFRRLRTPMFICAAALSIGLAACSSKNTPAASAGPATPSAQPSAAASQPPVANGTIAQVSGSQLQIQNQAEGQVTVYVNSKTAISKTVSAKRTDLSVGRCVSVTGPEQTNSGTPSADNTTPFSAVDVRITSASGTCATGPGGSGGGGGGNGGFGGRGQFTPPAGATPFPRPSNRTFARRAVGKVTSVSGSTITVERSDQSGSTTTTTITLTGSTTYTKTVKAAKSALVVGQCATAIGQADETGAITASTIQVSAPDSNGCSSGFGGGFGGGGFGPPPGGAAPGQGGNNA
jgi:hypothetical protein